MQSHYIESGYGFFMLPLFKVSYYAFAPLLCEIYFYLMRTNVLVFNIFICPFISYLMINENYSICL